MLKLKDYIDRYVVIYEDTPMYESGAIVKVLDYDSISYGEPSFLVSETQTINDKYLVPTDVGLDYASVRTSEGKWVKLSDIKQVISYTRPKEYKFITKIKGYIKEAWIRLSKIL